MPQKALDYVSEQTWNRLTTQWNGDRCRDLAGLAQRILAFKKGVHALVALLFFRLLTLARRSHPERVFARELARAIPLPFDQKLTAVAQGIRVVGIWRCLVDGDLEHCACLIDLLKAEGVKQAGAMFRAAMDQWLHPDAHSGAAA